MQEIPPLVLDICHRERLARNVQIFHPLADMEFYVKCPQAAYGPSKMSTQVTTLHDVK